MIVKQLMRYPFKGLMGEGLTCAQLGIGSGVVGDRRFAFGIDDTIDDGVWRSTRSYLINSVNDNLLKLGWARNQDGWVLRAPTGESAWITADGVSKTGEIDALFHAVLAAPENQAKRPCLIDRKNRTEPKAHWDFTDSELSIVNLATLRELELRWNIAIDPRRFRANMFIDGTPPWSEFALYGAKFELGSAQIEILRPSRRCAATSVNPATGDRDVDLLQQLVRDYGHGFLGVYARVAEGGDVAVGDEFRPVETSVFTTAPNQCALAPDASLWPKAAVVIDGGSAGEFTLAPVGPSPLAENGAIGQMKIHTGEGASLVAEILAASNRSLNLKTDGSDMSLRTLERMHDVRDHVIVSGPFFRRVRAGQ